MRLLEEIKKSLEVVESDASLDLKHSIIFSRHREVIQPLLERLNISFEWCDIRDSYENMIRSYSESLRYLKEDLEKLPGDCVDFV